MNKILLFTFCAAGLIFTSCKKDKPEPENNNLRSSVDYNALTDATPYNSSLFFDSRGDSTVDRTEGHVRLKMLKEIDTYGKLGIKQEVDANKLKNMFNNSGNPFGIEALDNSGLQIRNVTATSSADAETIRNYIESHFTKLAEASKSFGQTASKGNAGVLTNGTSSYLVDEDGIEWIQVISKSLIGSFQLDYIGNTLLGNLEADNSALVEGENYSQLEHNWDVAYGLLTTNPIYAADGTKDKKPSESFLGSYVWEYNRNNFSKIHLAFLKGRAAIINNDKNELKAQSEFIRKTLEKTISEAALGYLDKWKKGDNEGAKAHAIGEGIGFIYSLRFCQLYGADAKFSDDILDSLIFSADNGYWDLTIEKIVAAENAIKDKFND
ncbi:MAG TPA: DUF4856 domain-containing protein [Cytophagaceae bacterium]